MFKLLQTQPKSYISQNLQQTQPRSSMSKPTTKPAKVIYVQTTKNPVKVIYVKTTKTPVKIICQNLQQTLPRSRLCPNLQQGHIYPNLK